MSAGGARPAGGAGRFLWPAAVFLLAALPFVPSLDGQFLPWDDTANFVTNEGYRGLGWAQLRWMVTTPLLGHWIPLTWWTLGANYALGGMDPWGYHLGNLAFHAGGALCFYFVARRLIAAAASPPGADAAALRAAPPASAGAAFAALLFAVHPLRVESVAWVTERRDVLSGLFYLLAVLAYLRACDGGGPVRGAWRAASLAAFAAALLSKSIVMTLPGVLLLLDVYPLRRTPLGWRALAIEKIPYAILALAGAAVSLLALRLGASPSAWGPVGPGSRIAIVAYALWFYPWHWVWPVGLSPLYELPPSVNLLAPRFLVPLLAVISVTAILAAARRRAPWAFAAWLYSALVLLPVSGVVRAGFQLAHDRYSYLTGMGFALVAGGAVFRLLRAGALGRVTRPTVALGWAGATAVLLALGAASWGQSTLWRDSEPLWAWAVRQDPDCVICANNLAAALMRRQEPTPAAVDQAESLIRGAITRRPDHFTSYETLGAILAARGRPDEAVAALETARRLAPAQVGPMANLGALYARQGRFADALPLLRRALALQPAFPGLRRNLGYALSHHGSQLAQAGRLDEALPLLSEGAAIVTEDADTQRNLGQALVSAERPAEAVAPLERAVSLAPGSPAARFWLIQALAKSGRAERAGEELARLRAIDPAAAAHLEATLTARPGPPPSR